MLKKTTSLIFAYCSLLLFIIGSSSCEKKRFIRECDTFMELKDPTADTLSDWSAVTPGLHISEVPIRQKISKSKFQEVPISKSINVTGWKGEKVSAQLVAWSTENINQLECEFSEFKSDNYSLSAGVAQARFVRYVMTDEFGPGCGHRKPEDFAASLAPDMLDNLTCFDLEAKTMRPIWITIDIPSEAQAGTYKGVLEVYSREQDTQKIDVTINVVDNTLPEPSEWAYHLDLWQHPSAVARIHNVEVWSDEHFEIMKPLMKMLADGGQKVITATLNKDPWDNQCFDPYADMILWTKKKDATWTFDYAIFDKWVQFMMDLGVTKMINCYSLLTWNNKIHYLDEAKGEKVEVELKARSQEYKLMWSVFLKDFSQHLKEKGWLEKTNIAMDERAPEDMKAALNVLKMAAPELGISLADNHKSYKEYPWIKDICAGTDSKVDVQDIKARREKGLITTYYVCCSSKFPNMFTFSPSSESVYTAWYATACDYDGFLRWAYNSWVENPLTDSRFRTWPAGDTYMVYPDARSSIRFERLVEGIQDAEKIRILRKMYTTENTQESLKKLEKLNQTIATFGTLEPSSDWEQKLIEAKNLLNN